MSAKTVKRSSRSTDEITSPEVPTIAKKDIVKEDTNSESLNSEEAKNETTAEDGVKTRSQTNSQQNGNSIEDVTVKQSQEITSITNDKENGSDETETKPDAPEVTNSTGPSEADVKVTNSEIPPSNGTEPNEDECAEAAVETRDIAEPEAEPLVLDSEEVELQFDECSDVDSQKGSPILSRCRTRRSQTRNIPTPKTPKPVSEQNGDDNAETESNAVSEPVVPSENGDASEKAETEMEATDTQETESEISVQAEEMDLKCDVNDSFESCESSASTKVNVGSDLTREIDLSYPERESSRDPDYSSIRRLSSRRSIRPNADIRKSMLKTRIENQEYTCTRSSVEKVVGTKRKNRSETPDGVKRYKVENQQGLLSYIKSRFYPTEVSSSTPKLTGYKKQDIVDDAEISKIENDTSPPPEKKWCSVM